MNQHQHVDLIEYIVNKRVKNLNYIRRIHEGKSWWLNVVKITPEELISYYHPQTLQKRVQQWFFMGISLAPLLQLESGWPFVRALAQLMEEYEYHFSSAAVQGMKMLKALASRADNAKSDDASSAPSSSGKQSSNSPSVGAGQPQNQPSSSNDASEEHGDASGSATSSLATRAIRPMITKMGGAVVYEFLRTPNVPCELDYCQVVFSLCDILTLVYRKLLDDVNSAHLLHESIVKLDGRFKHHFWGLISKDLNQLSMYLIKQKLGALDHLLSGREGGFVHGQSQGGQQTATSAAAGSSNASGPSILSPQQQVQHQMAHLLPPTLGVDDDKATEEEEESATDLAGSSAL